MATEVIWIGIFSLMLGAFASPREGSSTTVTAPLSDLGIRASANCCPVAADPICIEEQCPIASQLRNAVDNDALTEVIVDFVSADSENGPQVQYSFFLEEVYYINSVTLLSTTLSLPQNWTLILSDNATFEQSYEFTNEGVYEQTAVPRTGEEEEGQVQASQIQVLFDLPSLASPQPVSLAEVVITITGVGLAEEQGCGTCVTDLTDSLDQLNMEIRNSTDLLSSVNQTQQQTLNIGIEEYEFSLREYLDRLRVLSVVMGIIPPLDSSFNITAGVERLDLILVPSILIKEDQLIDRVEDIETLDIDTMDLEMLVGMLESQLQTTIANLVELNATTNTHRSTLMELLDTLTMELANIETALMEANMTLDILLQRNFSAEMENLMLYNSIVRESLSQAGELLEVVTGISEEVDRVSGSLNGLEALLEETRNISQFLSCQSDKARGNADEVDIIIRDVQTMLTTAATLDMTLTSYILNVSQILENSGQFLQNAAMFFESSQIRLDELSMSIARLEDDIAVFSSQLSPYRPGESCNQSLCTYEFHAEMLRQNASVIVNSSESIYTLMRARRFLESIRNNGQLFNYSEVIAIAEQATMVAREALSTLATVNTTRLQIRSNMARSRTLELEGLSLELAGVANSTTSIADSLESTYTDLLGELQDLQQELPAVRNTTRRLLDRTGLGEEANELFLVAEDALNRTIVTNQTITAIDEGLDVVSDSIDQTRINVRDSIEALDTAESKFPSIRRFLNETQEAVNEFVFNVTTFIDENNRIVGQIDEIIARLSDIHERVNSINSPVQLLDEGEEESYISLQPPPGRRIDDAIQFESLDLYLWTGATFSLPTMLFYAGPVYMMGIDDIDAPREETMREDYFLLTVEEGMMLRLQGNVGGTTVDFSTPGFSLGFSEILVTRHGSQFEVRYGVRQGGLDVYETLGATVNGSQLFRTSNRTAFLLGGWPDGAQLGLPNSVVPLNRYNSFGGQVQLLLFNGDQWGLWNIRGASETDFIGRFQRSRLANQNNDPDYPISFDGMGYLFVDQFAGSDPFVVSNQGILTIETRPSDQRDGLVLYAYQEDMMVSLEVAYSRGSLRLMIVRHDSNLTVVDYTQPTNPDSLVDRVQVLYVPNIGFQINRDRDSTFLSDSPFFDNLSRVKAWYGGVVQSQLESPFVPRITTTGYQGCLNVLMGRGGSSILDRGTHFTEHYINSTVQRGFTGACLLSVYMREVSFGGVSFLPYSHLELVTPRNHPSPIPAGLGQSADGARVISFSFVSQSDDGILLVTIHEGIDLAVVLAGGEVQLRIVPRSDGSDSRTLRSGERIELDVPNYVLIELSHDIYSLYLNGDLRDSSPAISGASLEIATSPDGSSPAIYLGGSDSTTSAVPQGLPAFSGCMMDLAFNFSAMSFINPALPLNQRYPPGVGYGSCPLLNITSEPILAVYPDNPSGRTCLAEDPSEIEGTHGGFHRFTSLTTSNVIGLIQSSWTLSMQLRQMSDGHVVSLGSELGHDISLTIRDGRVVLTLTDPSDEGNPREAESSPLQEGDFIPVSIRCGINSAMLSCSLMVDGTESQVLQVNYPDTLFSPRIPLDFGRINIEEVEELESFIGCISELSINGDSSGFDGVQTDALCYSRTQAGYGFTGISRLGVPLSVPLSSEPPATASIVFQPHLDNGLVFMLTDSNGTMLAGAGLFNGQLIASNNVSLLNTPLCTPENPLFHTISIAVSAGGVEVRIVHGNGQMNTTSFLLGELLAEMRNVLLTIGNVPAGFTIVEGSDLFRFLLSSNVPGDSLPPGLSGCISSIMVGGESLQPADVIFMEQVLDGVCPNA